MPLPRLTAELIIWTVGLLVCFGCLIYVDFTFYLSEAEAEPDFRSPILKSYFSVATIYAAYAGGFVAQRSLTSHRRTKAPTGTWLTLIVAVALNLILVTLCIQLAVMRSITLQRFLDFTEPQFLTVLATALSSFVSALGSPRGNR